MAESAELRDFVVRIEALRKHAALAPLVRRGQVALGELDLNEIAELLKDEAGYYFLIAAAGLNRSSLKRAMADPEAAIVEKRLRKAFAVRKLLGNVGEFSLNKFE